jgi:hypothetical protein
MDKNEFNKLHKQINEDQQKISNFATQALKDYDYLEKNGIFKDFQRLQKPSERQIFIASNEAFKNFLKNFELFRLSTGELVNNYDSMIKKVSGSDVAEPSQVDS